ncbi:hypothetical protein [Nocardia terrae]|uniref:hypothetical protein n=1 Tax=Nocardia terrae TaxID=2675851 RepID=UPI0018DF8170|nr:hypothetical protein [Nocardia terrae]
MSDRTLDDLRRRLESTRWYDDDGNADAGCDVGSLVTGQLGHKYADALYGIHIGSGQRLGMFNGERAWDITGGRPIPEGLPEDVHARIIALEKRFAVHVTAHDHGGHFIPWEIPAEWTDDLRRTFRGRR